MQNFEDILFCLDSKNKDYEKLCELLTYEEVLVDKKLFLQLNNRKNFLEPVIKIYKKYLQISNNIFDLKKIIQEAESNDKRLFEIELENEEKKQGILKQDLIKMFLTLDAQNENIMIEIIKLKEELSTKLFDLMINAYTNFCKQNGFDFRIDKQKNSIVIEVTGLSVKNYFSAEVGLHNAVLGEILGYCQVFVYDNIKSNNFKFDENELKIEVCRSSGAGGQHINTTDSSIKIIHLPTGITAVSQDERSQFQNKQIALERIKEKVNTFIEKQKTETINKQKKEQLKNIKNVVKIYNFESGEILKNNNEKFLFTNFLEGKQLN